MCLINDLEGADNALEVNFSLTICFRPRADDEMCMTNATKNVQMNLEIALERLLQLCVSGDRVATRTFIEQAQLHGYSSMQLSNELYW